MKPVVIRLKRIGTKKKAAYRIVAAESRRACSGRILEDLGFYDLSHPQPKVQVRLERVEAWLQRGAQPSPTVASLVRRARRAGKTTAS